MRFDVHIRQTVRARLADVSSQMAAWDQQAPASPDLHRRLVDAIEPRPRSMLRARTASRRTT